MLFAVWLRVIVLLLVPSSHPPFPPRHRHRLQPPNALVVHLKRFVFARKAAKVKHQVQFGDKLELRVSGPEKSAQYDLTG